MIRNRICILLCASFVIASQTSCHALRGLETHGQESQIKDIVVEDMKMTELSGASEIIIDYGTVEGFGVTVRLFPKQRLFNVFCQALIDLEYDGKHRLYLHDVFCDPNQADTLASGTVLRREYRLPAGADARHLSLETFSEMPFFFLDVDFDGEKELVLNLARQGQRWLNAYLPIHLGYDYLYDNLKEEPFTMLDDSSELDYDKNTITLHSYNGAGSWYDEVYTYSKVKENSLFRPSLISSVEIEYDTWDEENPRKRTITQRRDTTEWITDRSILKKR